MNGDNHDADVYQRRQFHRRLGLHEPGGSVALLSYSNDCSSLSDFTTVNSGAGTADVLTNPGAITLTCNTVNTGDHMEALVSI